MVEFSQDVGLIRGDIRGSPLQRPWVIPTFLPGRCLGTPKIGHFKGEDFEANLTKFHHFMVETHSHEATPKDPIAGWILWKGKSDWNGWFGATPHWKPHWNEHRRHRTSGMPRRGKILATKASPETLGSLSGRRSHGWRWSGDVRWVWLLPCCLTQMLPWCWNIYLHRNPKNVPNVVKYSIHGASG